MSKYDEVIEHHHLCWQGIHITIEFKPNWSRAMNEAYGSPMAHIGITSQDRVPLPFTSTGYRSDFQQRDTIEAGGGVVAYVHSWLDVAAQDPKWIDAVDLGRQIELF